MQLDNLLNDPERAERLGQAGRERVLERYTNERIARATYELYEMCSRGIRARGANGPRPQKQRDAGPRAARR